MSESLKRLILFDQRGDINKLLSYEMESPQIISLHFSEVKDASMVEKKNLLTDGFRQLAHKVATYPNFRNVDEIVALSFMPTKYRRFMEGLGFEVLNKGENHPLWSQLLRKYRWRSIFSTQLHPRISIEPSLAVMSREKLLNRYPPPIEDSSEQVAIAPSRFKD